MLQLVITNNTKDELLIDSQEGSVGFTVLSESVGQLDFSIERQEWELLREFINESIRMYETEKEESRKLKANRV